MPDTYKIVRFFHRSGCRRAVRWNLTLEQAQSHCSDPESSWQTARNPRRRRRTSRAGPWFDGFYRQ
jgi:hypothetical protein